MAAEAVKVVHTNGAKPPEQDTETGEKPVFDFSRTSYTDARKFSRLQLELQHLTRRIMNADPMEDITPLLDKQGELADAQEKHILSIVVSVPRSWLVAGAPDGIDWQDIASLRYLRSDKFMKLLDQSAEAQNAKN